MGICVGFCSDWTLPHNSVRAIFFGLSIGLGVGQCGQTVRLAVIDFFAIYAVAGTCQCVAVLDKLAQGCLMFITIAAARFSKKKKKKRRKKGRTQILFMGPLIPYFGFLLTSALGFIKTRVDPSLACFLASIQWIPEIHLWCNTWLYSGQYVRGTFLTQVLANISTSIGGDRTRDWVYCCTTL